jgi:hypothetical protein
VAVTREVNNQASAFPVVETEAWAAEDCARAAAVLNTTAAAAGSALCLLQLQTVCSVTVHAACPRTADLLL